MYTKEKDLTDELKAEADRLKIEIMAKLGAIKNLEEIITEYECNYQKVCVEAE
jgi:hypothetical protein